MTCSTDRREPRRTCPGQAFNPRAGPAYCPGLGAAGALSKGATERGDHQRRSQIRSLIPSLIHVRVPRSITGYRRAPSRAGDQHGQPWTVILNPEKRKVTVLAGAPPSTFEKRLIQRPGIKGAPATSQSPGPPGDPVPGERAAPGCPPRAGHPVAAQRSPPRALVRLVRHVLTWSASLGSASMSDFGSRMGAARLGQAASDAVIVTLRRSLNWANAVT